MSSIIIDVPDLRQQHKFLERYNRNGMVAALIEPGKICLSHENPQELERAARRTRVHIDKRDGLMHTYLNPHVGAIQPHELQPNQARSWFKATEYATIYGFPAPDPSKKVVVGVVSFGGGLVGTVNADKILVSGDCQEYWTYLGITSHPVVKIVEIGGATNMPNPNDNGATAENSLDVQMIGAACPSSNLTIILYLVPNTFKNFETVLNYILNTNVDVNGTAVKPDIISISWGAPEIYYSNIQAINTYLSTAASRGIPVTVATGDNGSNNGVGGTGNYCDFPSSSPNVIACGGTNLICPNYVHDSSTIETAWNNGGGAISRIFPKPSYQSSLSGTYRKTPDIAMCADPNTGVLFRVGGQYVVYGGTSVVSPAMAGYLAAIDCSIFVNPRLYIAPSGSFYDITVGTNGGYAATGGYDNCTGLGSIVGGTLKNVLGATISVSGVSLTPSSVTIGVGQTAKVTPTVSPSIATDKTVTYSTNNATIAAVSLSGVVTGISAGVAIITCTTNNGEFTATSSITVTQRVTGVTITRLDSSIINIAQALQLTATVNPVSSANKTVSWSSSRPTIARVNSTGVVTGVSKGNATLTVRTQDGNFTANFTVTVTVVPVSITLNRSTLNLKRGTSSTLIADVRPNNADNKRVAWSNSNPLVASVTTRGVVRALKVGTTVIAATTVVGELIASCTITVS